MKPRRSSGRMADPSITRRNGTTMSTTFCMRRQRVRLPDITETTSATRKGWVAPRAGLCFQGELMKSRGSPRGEPSGHLPPTAFVSFIQNHDQVGNRPFGDRLTSFAPAEAMRAVISIYLLLPQIPMLFMGEEFGAAQPFPFFAQFEPELADAVREGRRAEFASFPEFADPHKRETIPDPTSEQTFRSARLNWNDAAQGDHAEWLELYRKLLSIRQQEIVPRLRNIGENSGCYHVLRQADIETAELEMVILDLLKGQYKNPVRVVAFNTAEK
jgi:1,4-alpha-glucan branching enzyme